MAVGQGVLTAEFDVRAAEAVEVRLGVLETERSAQHARVLRSVLELDGVYSRSGMGVAVPSQVALVMGGSEHRAGALLEAGVLLSGLPGGLEAVECGLLGVEQGAALVAQLAPLGVEARLVVWAQLRQRLVADDDAGVQWPPARLREWLARRVIAVDPDAAAERRRDAARHGDVSYRRRDDGLVDLSAFGITGPDAHACLSRIRAAARPVGLWDDRPAGKRRVDALVDLVLGRTPRPTTFDELGPEGASGIVGPGDLSSPSGSAHCPPGFACRHDHAAQVSRAPAAVGAACGCRPGAPVPCGAQLNVLVPYGAALGTTGELAELVGHGPLEPDLLADLLLAAPKLRAVWVDDAGVPVAVSRRTRTPGRDDPGSVRHALLRLLAEPPGPPVPRNPDDHPPPDDDDPNDDDPPDCADLPDDGRPGLRLRAHPVDTPGPYRVPRRLRRLLELRSPRCEWPGCGSKAVSCSGAWCDMDHDLAWPCGPTCSCQVGPLCRRHHRIKQLGWAKQRTRTAAVRWTSPTGQNWLSPAQHQPPARADRALPALPGPADPFDQLSPDQQEHELRHLDPGHPGWEDPAGLELRVEDADPDDPDTTEAVDALLERILHTDTRWTLDLDDPHPWLDVAPV